MTRIHLYIQRRKAERRHNQLMHEAFVLVCDALSGQTRRDFWAARDMAYVTLDELDRLKTIVGFPHEKSLEP